MICQIVIAAELSLPAALLPYCSSPKPGKPDIDAGQKKTESHGTQTIEGVTAEGTHSTVTIPAGEIGNTLPIEIVDET